MIALATGAIFGVLPASLIGRLHPSEQTLRGKPGSPDRSTKHVRNLLLAALTLILVTSSFSMGRTFLQLLDADLGLRPANVVTPNMSLQGARHRGAAQQWRYYSDALESLRRMPGVEVAGAVGHLPFTNSTTATLTFALLALLLAVVGIYGSAAYAVTQRRHEMGVRLALGATHTQIRALVVKEAVAPVAVGIAAGLVGALASGRFLEHLLVNAHRVDLLTCAAGAAVLLLGGFMAARSATVRILGDDLDRGAPG